jgi:hypothetical protein
MPTRQDACPGERASDLQIGPSRVAAPPPTRCACAVSACA